MKVICRNFVPCVGVYLAESRCNPLNSDETNWFRICRVQGGLNSTLIFTAVEVFIGIFAQNSGRYRKILDFSVGQWLETVSRMLQYFVLLCGHTGTCT